MGFGVRTIPSAIPLSKIYVPEDVAIGEFPKSRRQYKSERLPFEDKLYFSRDRISLNEMTEALIEDLQKLDSHACAYNRFAEKYLNATRRLEKLAGYLGSCALTMAIREKQGELAAYDAQDILNMLFAYASYHFRKTHDAIGKTTVNNSDFWFGLLDMETRWYVLVQRLEATEKKIRGIRSGAISVESLLRVQKIESTGPGGKKEAGKVRALNQAQAFPILKEALENTEGKNAPNDAAKEAAASAPQPELPEPEDIPMPAMPQAKQPAFSLQKGPDLRFSEMADRLMNEWIVPMPAGTKDPPPKPNPGAGTSKSKRKKKRK